MGGKGWGLEKLDTMLLELDYFRQNYDFMMFSPWTLL